MRSIHTEGDEADGFLNCLTQRDVCVIKTLRDLSLESMAMKLVHLPLEIAMPEGYRMKFETTDSAKMFGLYCLTSELEGTGFFVHRNICVWNTLNHSLFYPKPAEFVLPSIYKGEHKIKFVNWESRQCRVDLLLMFSPEEVSKIVPWQST